MLSDSLKSDDLVHQEFISKLEVQIAQDPTKVRAIGLYLQLKA